MKARFILWLKGVWIKYKRPILYVGVILACFLGFYILGRLSTRQERNAVTSNYIALQGEVKEYKVTIEGLENKVYEKDVVILSEKQAKEVGLLEIERLRKLHIKEVITNTELSGIIKRQDSLLNLLPKIEFITIKDSSGIKKNYVRYPFQLLNKHDQYLSLDAGLDSLKKAWFKLSTPFVGKIIVANVKSGFLKITPKGIFTTTNPYIMIDTMNVLIVKEPDKIWNKTWFHIGAGAVLIEGIRLLLTK
jgi:hypothetical protein